MLLSVKDLEFDIKIKLSKMLNEFFKNFRIKIYCGVYKIVIIYI